MVIVSRVGRRGQITLPSAIRQALGVVEGDRVAFVRQGDVVVIQPMSLTLRDLRGSVPVAGAQDFAAIRQAALARSVRRRGEESRHAD